MRGGAGGMERDSFFPVFFFFTFLRWVGCCFAFCIKGMEINPERNEVLLSSPCKFVWVVSNSLLVEPKQIHCLKMRLVVRDPVWI